MPLITVYFPGSGQPDEFPYRKALIDPINTDYFVCLGAVMSQEEAENLISIPEVESDEKSSENASPRPDPAKGWGKPGSLRWHNSFIDSVTSVNELYQYILAVTGQKMAKGGSLFNLKRNAMKRIKEYMSNDKNS